ncbi:hypothetical protein [Natronobacterium lacisalsi]|nr:hypothetical protein [Halobiforma lacisalsi]
MARDFAELDDGKASDRAPTDGGKGSNSSLLGRRSYMKVAGGVAAASVAAGNAAAAGGNEEYDVIELGPGETRTKTLSDGETFENVLIDITADNASFNINAMADDWTIRNVGLRGNWDSFEKNQVIACRVNSPDAEGHIENFYFMGNENDNTYPGITGIFVSPRHRGTLHIDRVNIQNCPDNAIYASAPGNPDHHSIPGGNGDVHISNSFAADCQASNFRLGTDGSTLKNCVAVGGDRGFWGFYNNPTLIDCDLSGARAGRDIQAGAGWETGAEVTVENCRFDDARVRKSSLNAIHGESVGSPQRFEPSDVAGVPLSAEDAASGSGSTPDPSPPEEPDDEDRSIDDVWRDDAANHLELEAGSGSQAVEYRISGLGSAETGEYANTNPDDPYRDGITSDGDEFEIAGYLGGYVDDFHVDGAITAVESDATVTAVVNGQEFDLSALEGVGSWDEDETDGSEDDEGDDTEGSDDPDRLPHALVIDGREASEPSTYSFTVDGSVTKAERMGASIDDEDEIEDGTVRGAVGNWLDAYWFEGDITDFRLLGDAQVHLEYDARDE